MAAAILMNMLAALVGVGRDEEGQTMAEYGLLLAGIAIVVMAVVLVLGPAIAATFQEVVDSL
ncbi:MAG: Flp family type IVb pilin [Dehalococcoidia bacterium]|jgi:pilus assembly protein Flp/PilA|nr:Flp family type IVb pilin [Dehalococcoidia bacterium]